MILEEIIIENFRCYGSEGNVVKLQQGLTALVGENDAGKTTIIDAIRLALGTTDLEWMRVSDSDFHMADTELVIKIKCKFTTLSKNERAALLEYLTYEKVDDNQIPVFFFNWSAKKKNISSSKSFIKTEASSGKNADGPQIDQEVKELLRITYLKPLRDADSALSSGKNSRISRVLQNIEHVTLGSDNYKEGQELGDLSISGIASLADMLLQEHKGISNARNQINDALNNKLSLSNESLTSRVTVSNSMNANARLRSMLEKLNVQVNKGESEQFEVGLGSKNLLYIACELLLLEQEKIGAKILLIEEPEAHIHAQRQLKILKSLQNIATEKGIQVIVSTHSPVLASAVNVENFIYIQKGRAFSLKVGETKLSPNDYSFLQRFLDVTKANLFFAKSVMIVEGDAENLLLPVIAKLLGRCFTDYGVSIVNVGGVGLSRYAKIFQRSCVDEGVIEVNVACLTDSDVIPDSAVKECKPKVDLANLPVRRNWKLRSEYKDPDYDNYLLSIKNKCDGQNVRTFLTEDWTLEYALSKAGLFREVYVAAKMAIKDATGTPENKTLDQVKCLETLFSNFRGLSEEEKAAKSYAEFTTGTKASKAIAAQYLGSILEEKYTNRHKDFKALIPQSILEAIEHVTEPFSDSNYEN